MDEFNMDKAFDMAGCSLNYAEITKQKDLMAMTRLLAVDLMRDGYINVGNYIKDISDADLESLIEEMDREDSKQYDDILLISEMLATGEGCDASKTTEDFQDRMSHMMILLVCESLARKGLVKIHHKNMSFHSDMRDEIVAEKLDD